jgi:hypothetical protein
MWRGRQLPNADGQLLSGWALAIVAALVIAMLIAGFATAGFFIATRRQRLLGFGAGLLVLVAFNLFRITTSIYVEWSTGVNIHDYFYFFNMVFVLCVWAIWLRIIGPKRRAAVPKAA